MSLKFTALKLEEGDAFLLQDDENNRNFLFDSGGAQKTIEGLLNVCGVNKLDVAICSHNDKDHSKGFIGLLNSNSFTIDEIWLPSLWGSIICFIDANIYNKDVWSKIGHSIHSYYDVNAKKWQEYPLNRLYERASISADELDKRLARIDRIYVSYKNDKKDASAYAKFVKAYKSTFIVKQLENIIQIATLAVKKCCRIVWFENTFGCVNIQCQYGFYSLNSKPICILNCGISKSPWVNSKLANAIKPINVKSFIDATVLTVVNIFSLVFEFKKDTTPIVRFSADSNCDCQSHPYYNSIIITAPHHGSNIKHINYYVYKLGNDNTIWVRTRHHKVTPCNEFLQCKNRYCVKCPNPPIFQEVSFEYSGNHWITQSGKCCQCKP